ncbi:leucine zipper domain-containing protein [Streptomyces sp. NBC_00859]|nr:leucine zipper domain-containing protein [Streptomyces sp. NBC_00859]
MFHPNVRLTVHGRRLVVARICSGRPVTHIADEMGNSRTTAYEWVRRWRAEGDDGLGPMAGRMPEAGLRCERGLGPAPMGRFWAA